MLTNPDARALFGSDWAQEAQRMAALFGATYDQGAGDPAFEELVSTLSEASDEFRGWWCSHHVASPLGGYQNAAFRRPERQDVRLRQLSGERRSGAETGSVHPPDD